MEHGSAYTDFRSAEEPDARQPRAYASLALSLLFGALLGGVVASGITRPLAGVGALTGPELSTVSALLQALLVLYPLWLGVGMYLLERIEAPSTGDTTREPLRPYDANALFLSYLVLFFLVDGTVVVLGSVVPGPVAVSMRLLSLFVVLSGVFVFNRLPDVLTERGYRDPTANVMALTVAAILAYFYVLFWEGIPFAAPPREAVLLVALFVVLATARAWLGWYRDRD